MKLLDFGNNKKFFNAIKRGHIYYSFIIIFILLLVILLSLNKNMVLKQNINIYKNRTEQINLGNKEFMNNKMIEASPDSLQRCYSSPDNPVKKILHLIMTRFLVEFYRANGFPKNMYTNEYILNGVRVMKKYLIPSLESQLCKNFTWVLMVGDKANITFINSLLKLDNTFEMKIIYKKDVKNYVRNKTKDIDILITTRIDYDDRIYYDAVNDVRKAININKPIIAYGYNRGMFYFEDEDKYYYYYYRTYDNKGVMSIFISLIIVLNRVNDTYTVNDLGTHVLVRKNILEKYRSFGIKELNYEPAIFDSGEPKFVWVRQNYSGQYNRKRYSQYQKLFKEINFNLSKFYGK